MAEKPPIRPLGPDDKPEPGITPRQELLIGRVCVSWANLEAAMQDILWQMLDVPIDDGRIITANADANRKLQWLHPFAAKHLAGDELAELKAALAKIEEARQARNFVVHGTWGRLNGEPICMSVKEKSPDPTEIVAESFPPWRMEELIKSINEGRIALMEWANSHSKARGKEPPYPPGPFPTRK